MNTLGASVVWGNLFQGYDTAQALSCISCPIFLALGRHDYFNPPHLWQGYEAYTSDLTLHIFEKSGHTPQLEEAAVFDQVLLEWIGSKRGV
jgi:proline iminopeptidase